jgi:hypothetical protein
MRKQMKVLAMLTSASVLAACASTPPPEQFGFRRVPVQGEEHFCAPPRVALRGSPWVADLSPGSHLPAQDICLTQAEWPKWLMFHSRLTNNFVPVYGAWSQTTP